MNATITPQSPPLVSAPSSAGLGVPARLYSVICAQNIEGKHTESVVATGLTLQVARALGERLDREGREKVEAAGKHYSSWTADLHHCQLETPNGGGKR